MKGSMMADKIRKSMRSIKEFLIHPDNIRISIFNIMAFVGCMVSLAAFGISHFNGSDLLNLSALLSCAVISSSLLAFAKKTGHYRTSYLITIVIIFMVLFPLMFFTAGGLFSGMPVYFALAVSFTVFMLENRLGLIISLAEIVEYVLCSVAAMYFPDAVIPFDSEKAAGLDVISGVVVCSMALAVTLYFQTALYHSQQKKTEDALDEVSRQSKAKDVFLANMSHEIRTPIGMILGMSEMIDRTATDRETREYNAKITLFGRKLLSMIKDILDITRIRTGQTELAIAPYSLEEVVTELSLLGGELAAQKHLTFAVERDYPEDLTLTGDKEHLLQIVSNLVTNAVKYTEKGGVTLRVQTVPQEDGKRYSLTVRTEDTGIGIPDEALSHIFELFYRVGSTPSHSVEGTGLGLAIVKELTERMGGSITVESMVGVGTTFTLRLEQDASEQTVTAQTRTDTHFIAPECRILVVDDNTENLELLKTLLGRTMIRIDTADNGIDGIRLAVRRTYDVIVLDYMMPEPDGIETLSRMKRKGVKAAFIALTADAIAGTGAKLAAAGFDEYVTKPVDWKKFEQLLLRYIPREKVAFESFRQSSLTPEQLAELTARTEQSELDILYGFRRVDNSLDIYRKILILFCSHYKQNHVSAEKHFSQSDWKGLRLIVHSLKAQARGIGGNLLFQMAETMEQKLIREDIDYVTAAFPLLCLQWERTQRDASLLVEMLPEDEKEPDTESVNSLTEKAVYALKNNLWLNAREAVEALQRTDKRRNNYDEILQLIERFAFKEALKKLQNRTETI